MGRLSRRVCQNQAIESSLMLNKLRSGGPRMAFFGLLLFLFPALMGQPEPEGDHPLPDLESLLERIRDNLHSDRFLLRHYTYNQTEEVVELDKKEQPKKTRTRIYEIFPSAVEGMTYRRLISKDGEPVQEKDLRKQDEKYNKRVRKYAKKARKKGVTAQTELEAAEAELLRREREVLDETFRLFQFEIQGRDRIDGHDSLILTFTPRPKFKSGIKDIKFLEKIQGRAWVSLDDHQLVRIEAETMDSIKLGFGIIARLNRGAHMVFERRKINDEVWLPARAFFRGRGRILLLKGFRFQATSEYSGYRKFSVASQVSFPSGQP